MRRHSERSQFAQSSVHLRQRPTQPRRSRSTSATRTALPRHSKARRVRAAPHPAQNLPPSRFFVPAYFLPSPTESPSSLSTEEVLPRRLADRTHRRVLQLSLNRDCIEAVADGVHAADHPHPIASPNLAFDNRRRAARPRGPRRARLPPSTCSSRSVAIPRRSGGIMGSRSRSA